MASDIGDGISWVLEQIASGLGDFAGHALAIVVLTSPVWVVALVVLWIRRRRSGSHGSHQ